MIREGVHLWLSTTEIGKFCGVGTRQVRNASRQGQWRDSQLILREERGRGRGGKTVLIRLDTLPAVYRNRCERQLSRAQPGETSDDAPAPQKKNPGTLEDAWANYNRSSQAAQQKGQIKAATLQQVESLMRSGLKKSDAVARVAMQRADQPTSEASIWRDFKRVAGHATSDWAALLTPKTGGGVPKRFITPAAWAMIREDYLRLEAPALTACIDRARRHSRRNGLDWQIPSAKTVQRRINEIPIQARVLAREGVEALERLYPAQERDHAYYESLEALNADGHKFDVFVRFEDGTVGRPIMAAFQDIRSGKLLGYRVGQTENSDLIRLAFGDLVEDFGVPDHVYLDNGRGFASKWLTGGAPTRYRFKVKADEPTGIFKTMGVQMHWCQPYHGQAKPIERAFRDLCEYVARHPAFAGAYTGNNPTAKPENYGSRAIPIALFKQVLDEEIVAHNARTGRRGGICHGRSFDEVFRESYDERKQRGEIHLPVEHQRLLWLLTAEAVTAKRPTGEITLAGNRYWTEQLVEHAGTSVVVRFDPDKLHETVWVYQMDGRLIAPADCIASAGFGDTTAARDHARQKKRFKRAAKDMLEAERRMNVLEGTLPTAESATDDEMLATAPIRMPVSIDDNNFNPEEAFEHAARVAGSDLI